MRPSSFLRAGCAAGLLVTGGVHAQTEAAAPDAAPSKAWTIDLTGNQSRLSAGLPTGHAVNLRATWHQSTGTVVNGEWLSESKFGTNGGIGALGVTQVLDEDWFVAATGVAGRGGPNWAKTRVDGAVSRKWLEQRQLITTVGLYRATYDNDRSDRGARLSLAYYFDDPFVLEGGATFNTSNPGSSNSQMPFVAATWGREGQQYLSARYANGTEAWQVFSNVVLPVKFRSQSLSADWRQWIAPDWGVTLRAERYLNPTYQRSSLAAGVFVQF